MKNARRGFTLVEILVVITILGVLMAILVASFGGATKKAQKQKCSELVHEVATMLTAMYDTMSGDREGIWPAGLMRNSNTEQGLDENAGYYLARKGMSLSYDGNSKKLTGNDRFGIVTPWAVDAIKKVKNNRASRTTPVPSGGTVESHRLRYALCSEDGYVEGANVGGEALNINVKAAVWCGGADGKIEPYSEGRRGDDVYSWDHGKVRTGK